MCPKCFTLRGRNIFFRMLSSHYDSDGDILDVGWVVSSDGKAIGRETILKWADWREVEPCWGNFPLQHRRSAKKSVGGALFL